MSDKRPVEGALYDVGPILEADERPWPIMWEQDSRIDDGHLHKWEVCLLKGGPSRHVGDRGFELVVRCRICHVPRCGDSMAADPCMERRHHHGMHFFWSGAISPVGGMVSKKQFPACGVLFEAYGDAFYCNEIKGHDGPHVRTNR